MIIDSSPDRAAGGAAGVAVVDDVVNGVGAGAAPETAKSYLGVHAVDFTLLSRYSPKQIHH